MALVWLKLLKFVRRMRILSNNPWKTRFFSIILKINKDWKLIQKQVLKNNKICFPRRNQDMSVVVDQYQNDGNQILNQI
jgi:hypothetical protein